MKKFIAKLFIFLLVITSLICCVNAAYIKMDRSDSQDIKKFKTIPKSVKVCNFGSSHSLYGFNYADVNGIDSFSFALSSQVLSYDRRIFENYLDNISEGAVVFITVSYFSFCIDDERNYSDFPQKNKRYYQILPPQLVKDYDLKTDIYSHYLPSLSAGMDLFTVLSGKSTENKEIDWTEKAINKDLIQDAETVSKRHLSFYAKDEAGNRISNQEEVDSLIYMIKKCKEKG